MQLGVNWFVQFLKNYEWKNIQQSHSQQQNKKDNKESFIREPANAWSAFGYFLVGLIILHCAVYDFFFNRVKNFKRKSPDEPRYIYTTNRLRRFPTFSLIYGFTNIYHAAGTFWNHACRCVAGMYQKKRRRKRKASLLLTGPDFFF